MRSLDFFESHPVFTHEEYVQARKPRGASQQTTDNLLGRHCASGRLIRVKRGLYATVPRGIDPEQATANPYLVATKMTEDAVVAYHAALQFHGKSYSLWHRYHYLTRKRGRPFNFRGMEFVPVQIPTALNGRPLMGGYVEEKSHAGGLVRITSFERTLVDLLAAPSKAGSYEELWRSLEMVEFFDLDTVIEYTMKRETALTAARVGFFLEQHREELMVEDQHLRRLQRLIPAQPRYFDSSRESGRLVSKWNLIVPQRILDRSWGEVL